MQSDGGVRLRISYVTCEFHYIPAEQARSFMDAYEAGEFKEESEVSAASVELQPDGSVRLEISRVSHEIREIPAGKARNFWRSYKSGRYQDNLRAEIAKLNTQRGGEDSEA